MELVIFFIVIVFGAVAYLIWRKVRNGNMWRKNLLLLKRKLYAADSFELWRQSLEEVFVDVLGVSSVKLFLMHDENLEASSVKVSYCLPLQIQKENLGKILLGPKKNGQIYSSAELAELENVQPSFSGALMNLLLQKRLEEVKALFVQQSDFLAVTAHEFRTPLSIALFQLEETIENYNHNPALLEDMKVMVQSLNSLKDLTQRLFDVQKYDLNKVRLELSELDLVVFLQEIVLEFALVFKKSAKALKFENLSDLLKVKVFVDEGQLRQVMVNLLSNAMKFGKSVCVQLLVVGSTFKVRVIDDGPGIADVDKERVFDKFQTAEDFGALGIGMGLYLCKKIVQLHQGRIWVEDGPFGGSMFVFEIDTGKVLEVGYLV